MTNGQPEQGSIKGSLDGWQTGLHEFRNDLFDIIEKTHYETIKDYGTNKLTQAKKVEIGNKTYDAIKGLYSEFLGTNSNKMWGKEEIAEAYERNCRYNRDNFVAGLVGSELNLEDLVNGTRNVIKNLIRHEGKKIGNDLKQEELPQFRKELADESKERYHVELDEGKIQDLDDAKRIYELLRANASPEQFKAVIENYLKQTA